MTVAALPGNVRLRGFSLGKETTFGTAVAATRRFPWTFAPTVDPHWTFPTADTGTLDQAINPYRTASDVTGTATGSLAFNDAPYLWAAIAKGGITPTGGAAKTWAFQPASTSQDIFEIFSGEWGDEVAADQYRYTSGVLDSLALTYPTDLGPVQVSANWRFASATYPNTRTALTVDMSPNWVYAADTSIYIDSTAGGIEGTQLVNTMHDATVTITNNIDVKRFANGSNTRFQAAGYGRGARTVEAVFSFAKSTAALTEVADWLNANPVERFLGIKTISPTLIPATATPYSHDVRFAGFWFTNAPGTYGTTNTTNQLVCHGIVDSTLTYPYLATVVTDLDRPS